MNANFKVKVFCSECGHIFWEDELLKWAMELQKRWHVPLWFTKARLHEKDTGHKVMVEYPNQTVSLSLGKIYGVYY